MKYTYEKLYHDLFNAITDALRLIDAGRCLEARELLIRAQQLLILCKTLILSF